MPEIRLSRGKIYYETHGKGEPLVGLHHGMSSIRAWKNQIEAFGRHFTFITYDRLGDGRSERHLTHEEGYFENRASELGELITHLGLDSVHLCGMCEGGAIALVFAASWPKKVNTLICQGVGYYTTDETIARCEEHFRPWSELDVALRHQLIRHHGQDYAMLKWEALREAKPYVWDPSYDLRPRFSRVEASTLIIAGDKDQFFDMEQAVAANDGIKNSRLRIMPETGHFPNERAPAVFNKVALDFLKRQAFACSPKDRQLRQERTVAGRHE